MVTSLRVQEWTKNRLDEIQEQEEHTSQDSVLKSLLLHRQMNTRELPDDGRIFPEEAGAILNAVVLKKAKIDEATIYCPACDTPQETVAYEAPTRVAEYSNTCGSCGATLNEWIAAAIHPDHLQGEPEADMLAFKVRLDWEQELGDLANKDRVDEAPRFSEYADAVGWDWRPRYPIESVDQIESGDLIELPDYGRTGHRAWRVGEIDVSGSEVVGFPVMKESGSSGTYVEVDNPHGTLDDERLEDVVEDGRVYRVIE